VEREVTIADLAAEFLARESGIAVLGRGHTVGPVLTNNTPTSIRCVPCPCIRVCPSSVQRHIAAPLQNSQAANLFAISFLLPFVVSISLSSYIDLSCFALSLPLSFSISSSPKDRSIGARHTPWIIAILVRHSGGQAGCKSRLLCVCTSRGSMYLLICVVTSRNGCFPRHMYTNHDRIQQIDLDLFVWRILYRA